MILDRAVGRGPWPVPTTREQADAIAVQGARRLSKGPRTGRETRPTARPAVLLVREWSDGSRAELRRGGVGEKRSWWMLAAAE